VEIGKILYKEFRQYRYKPSRKKVRTSALKFELAPTLFLITFECSLDTAQPK
jgi:hypothetical protein